VDDGRRGGGGWGGEGDGVGVGAVGEGEGEGEGEGSEGEGEGAEGEGEGSEGEGEGAEGEGEGAEGEGEGAEGEGEGSEGEGEGEGAEGEGEGSEGEGEGAEGEGEGAEGEGEGCLSFPEVCDGLDNDCDGATDEDGVCCTVTFDVNTPPSTPPGDTIYLAGSHETLGFWEPAGRALTRAGDNFWNTSILVPCGTLLEYKITRGTWETVETDAWFQEIPNHSVLVSSDTYVNAVVATWADQRPDGERCGTALPLDPDGDGQAYFEGDTSGASVDQVFGWGNDLWYRLDLPHGGVLTAALVGLGEWDTLLAVLSGGCDFLNIEATEDNTDGYWNYSLINGYPLTNGTYYLVVTSPYQQAGPFYLDVSIH
jgi:hypothetical protein